MKEKFININNWKIEYVVEGKGEDILFIHGAGMSFRSRILFINSLAKHFRVWVPSNIGAGKSSRFPRGWRFEDYAKFVKAFVDEFKIKPMISGHSLGGAIAIKTKSAFPNSFRNLVLFSSAGIKDKNASKTISIVVYEKIKAFISRLNADKRKDTLLNLMYHPLDLIKLIDLYRGLDLSGEIQSIGDEVFLFWGKDDEILPLSNMEVFAGLFQKCRTYVMEGSHDFLDFRGDKIVKAIKETLPNV